VWIILCYELVHAPCACSCVVEKSYLLDVFTKLYIATDSNPVDGNTYELCSDLVDVVIDVSCIYGLSQQDGAAIPYDHESSAAIHLNSGMVLYLREVSVVRGFC
jgi:Ras-related GTP-binding protein C/D